MGNRLGAASTLRRLSLLQAAVLTDVRGVSKHLTLSGLNIEKRIVHAFHLS